VVEPQDTKLEGATLRLTFEVLAFAMRVISEVLGLQVKESPRDPARAVAGNVIVIGLVAQFAFGDERVAKPTAAYAPAMMRLIERPTIRYGIYGPITDGN
jgi:hypothetical protein